MVLEGKELEAARADFYENSSVIDRLFLVIRVFKWRIITNPFHCFMHWVEYESELKCSYENRNTRRENFLKAGAV